MRLSFFFVLLALFSAPAWGDETLKVAGSSSLVQPFINASPALRDQNIDLKVFSDSNSPAAIAGVGSDACDLGVSTRPLLLGERADYPDRQMVETTIGYQALCFSVSTDVWQAGVRSISKKEMIAIYEGAITNWKALKGPDRKIKFFNPAQGKGMWEFFVTWMYSDMRKAPTGANFEAAASAEEARNLVEFNGGALAVLPPTLADLKGAHALAIQERGALIQPTAENVRNGTYPIMRPIIVVTAYRPSGAHKKVLDFMLSKAGQEIVKHADMVTVKPDDAE